MSANLKEKPILRYDPKTFGYSVISDAPEVDETHKPGEVYFSEDVMKTEIEEIFMKEWLLVGRVEEVEKSGDYFTHQVAEEPVVVARDKAGNIQAFANVCRHRGVKVAWGEGNTKYFSCPYHGWVYGTNGELVDAQYLDKSKSFDKKNCSLPKIRTEMWEGFIFINFNDDAQPLMHSLEAWDFPKTYEPYQMGRLRLANKFAMDIPSNWKFLNENLTDIYHIAVLHAATFGPAQPLEGYRYKTFDGGYHGRFTGGTLVPEGKSLFGPIPWLPEELHSGGFSSHLPPNVAWFPRFDYVSIGTNWPISADKSVSITYQLFPEDHFSQPDFKEKAQQYVDFYRAFMDEDTEMIDALQKGMKSRFYKPGPVSPFEAGVMGTIKHAVDDLGHG
ncbi:MAG: aromatic ring-hydroxylating dioxygenase subunit alpha [Proteobacteria bacterium]|nr:aromatic ring-hydroxylating dioxygenase subunit alpha [Pseudomonadota bacterium]